MGIEFVFFLNGRILLNNSIVLLSEIGEGTHALYCFTNATEDHGNWVVPADDMSINDNTTIISQVASTYIVLSRRSSTVGPTGIYTCVIPNAAILYIGVYIDDQEGKLLEAC
jgi:hypothetical protein